jgi:hypothetical protein
MPYFTVPFVISVCADLIPAQAPSIMQVVSSRLI